MQNANHRLSRKKDIDNVFKNGRSSYSLLLGVKAVKNQETTFRRAFIISTKVSKKAVERNLIRRRLNEIIRKEMGDRIKPFDFVIVVLPIAKGKSTVELRNSLFDAFTRLRLLNI